MSDRAHQGEGYPMTWSVITPCATCGCPVLMHNGIAVTVVLGQQHICRVNCTCKEEQVEDQS